MFLFMMFYLIATKYTSASNKIMYTIQKQGSVSLEQIKEIIPKKSMIVPRLNSLVEKKHVIQVDDRFVIQPSGALIIRLIKFYQRLFGLRAGG
jgi:predicted transcriptional regulator